MSRNGAGTYVLPSGNPVVTNTTISSTWANNTLSDIAGALTQSLSKDGQTTPTANLPMGGFKLTNLAAGSAPGNSLRYEQLFSQGIPTDIASASTVDIGAEYNTFLNVTGNTTITSFGTNYNGPRILTFRASLTLTHNATTLVCPASANIVTQAGDVAVLIPKSTTSGTADGWKVSSYFRANDVPLNNDAQTIASASTLDFTLTQAQLYSITGTTDVTAVTTYEAQPIYAIASGAFKLVNSASLIVQGDADYTCKTNDILMFIKDASGNVHVSIIGFSKGQMQEITATVATNALTINYAGGLLDFRSSTLNDGSLTRGVAVPSLSITVPSTATLGTINAVQSRLYVLVAYNSGTPVLCVSNVSGGLNLDESNLISPTTISTGSTSASVIYSAASVGSNSPYRVVGYIDITEATAGTWATAPTLVQGAGGQALDLSGVGFGQTWQSFNSTTRAIGTTYYNTTGKLIYALIGITSTASAGLQVTLTAAGVTTTLISPPLVSGTLLQLMVPVPPGSSYSATSTAGSPVWQNWQEMR